jgi:hypothetical protein
LIFVEAVFVVNVGHVYEVLSQRQCRVQRDHRSDRRQGQSLIS